MILRTATIILLTILSSLSAECPASCDDWLSPSLENTLEQFRAGGVANGVEFRETGRSVSRVLTLRIKRFFFDKILSGEKIYEFRERNPMNDKLIASAQRRKAKFLRLHFQDNDIQLLATIEGIDEVSGAEAVEPWDAEQGIEPSDKPHWRIKISHAQLIWHNPRADALAHRLRL